MTAKMAWTTEAVVRSPRLSTSPPTFMPWWQPITAMIMPKTGALEMPTKKCSQLIDDCRRSMKKLGEMSRTPQLTTIPPNRPDSMAAKVSSGAISTQAMTRGRTSTSNGSRPSTRIASISCCIFIEPIDAVKAESDRPASMIAVMSTPNSRSTATPTSSTVKTETPKVCNRSAPI